MTCDDAFDAMTGGVGPSGRTADSAGSPAELRQHLANCPRCRQMYETLSPALEGLDTVTAARPSAPWFSRQEASIEAVALARTVAADLSRSAQITRRWQHLVTSLRYAAVLFVGCALGASVLPVVRTSEGATQFPAGACTRSLVDSSTDAQALVKTCVACHSRTLPERWPAARQEEQPREAALFLNELAIRFERLRWLLDQPSSRLGSTRELLSSSGKATKTRLLSDAASEWNRDLVLSVDRVVDVATGDSDRRTPALWAPGRTCG